MNQKITSKSTETAKPSVRPPRRQSGAPQYLIPIGDPDSSAFEGDVGEEGDEIGAPAGHVELGDGEEGDTIYQSGDTPWMQTMALGQVNALKGMNENQKFPKAVPYLALLNGIIKQSPLGMRTKSFPYGLARQLCFDVRNRSPHVAIPKSAVPVAGVATVNFTAADLAVGTNFLLVPYVEITIRSSALNTPSGAQLNISASFWGASSGAAENIPNWTVEWNNTTIPLTARLWFHKIVQTEPDPFSAVIQAPASNISIVVTGLDWAAVSIYVTVPGTRLVSFMNFIEMHGY